MKKIFALVILLGSLAVLPGCNEDGCPGEKRNFFDVRGFSVENVVRGDTTLDINYWAFQPVDTNTTLLPSHFGIQLESVVHFYANADMTSLGSALACSPKDPGERGSKEIISEILITSDSDFDTFHPVGSVLNDLFFVSAATYHYQYPTDSLSSKAIPLSEFLNTEQKARRSLQLWLTKAPEISKQHRFTIKYTQTNGEEYIVQAPKAIFQ